MQYGEIPAITVSGTETLLTLDCGEEGVQLNGETSTSFCIVVPPTTFSKGFTATVYNIEDGTMEISTEKEQTINRSRILMMPAKEYVAVSATITAKSISLDITELTIVEDQKIKLTATVLTEDAEDKIVTWTSLESTIASVDETGVVIGECLRRKSAGNCRIRVTALGPW